MIDVELEKCKIDDACKLLGLKYEVPGDCHFRIEDTLDVWPSVKKVYTLGMSKAERYDNIENILRSVFRKFKPMTL